MEIPENMIAYIKKVAKGIDHGEILIKLNKVRNIIDVKASPIKRFYVEEEEKPITKPGGKRNG